MHDVNMSFSVGKERFYYTEDKLWNKSNNDNL